MFSIELTFLTGRYTASSYSNRREPEWPPHPARVFSALVAEYAEAGCCSKERKILEWLEALGHPEIYASSTDHRNVVGNFVPVNDASIVSIGRSSQLAKEVVLLTGQVQELLESSDSSYESTRVKQLRTRIEQKLNSAKSMATKVQNTPAKDAQQMLPDQRGKQLRYFPTTTPHDPCVSFVWQEKCSDTDVQVLDDLLSRVTKLGHSSTLVSCRITTDVPKVNFFPSIPSDDTHTLRGIRSGQLKELTKLYSHHQGFKPRVLPYEVVHYRNAEAFSFQDASLKLESNLVGEWIVFEFTANSRYLQSTRTYEVAKAMRAAIFNHMTDPIPEEVSGHQLDGTPTRHPHIAIQPIPYVGSKYADGRLLGLVIIIPKSIGKLARQQLFLAIGKWERLNRDSQIELFWGQSQRITLQRIIGRPNLQSLQPQIWCRSSRVWSSAVPIALPRHPGRLFGGSLLNRKKAWRLAEQGVVHSCNHVGLPDPAKVSVSPTAFIAGCRPSRAFPAFVTNNSISRQLIHAKLEFDELVRGPLVIGSGRFLGLGLMRPLSDND